MQVEKCDGLCSVCEYRETPIDGEYCGKCDREYSNFYPDWVTLICVYCHVSRNLAKKVYKKMMEDWQIRNAIKEYDKKHKKEVK